MSGPTSTRFTSFISLCSAIIQLSLTNLFQERTKAQFAHPEIKAGAVRH